MWTPFEYFIGNWQGEGDRQSGHGQYERSYAFVLSQKFLLVKNKSVYPPQEKNPQGETHEDMGMISFDKRRQTFVFRQFHVEGFVNQYVLERLSPDGKEFGFNSESIENIAPGWRARESYQIMSADEFTEVFELAAPGQDFEVYSQCRLTRLPAE